MTRRFQPYQKVVITDFMLNGNRQDTWGTVMRYIFANKVWKVEVLINEVYVFLPEERLIDYEEYWRNKKNGQ